MGDVGDFWRDIRDARRAAGLPARRSHRRPAKLVKFTKKHEALGFRQCSLWHWQTKIGNDLLDYWPSKSKWRFQGVTTVGSEKQLLAFLRAKASGQLTREAGPQ